MRVLFVSDVYFPRVNGVSTSIRTFRGDLARSGVETTLVAPAYPERRRRTATRRSSACPRAACRAIPRTAVSSAARCARARCRAGRPRRPGAHPHAVHRALRRRAFRARARAARGRDVPHLLRGLSASLRADAAARHRPIPRAAVHAFAVRRRRRADLALSAPMRDALAGLRRQTPIEVLPTGLPAESFVRGDGARFRRQFDLPAEPAAPAVRGPRGLRKEHRLPAAHVRARCARGGPTRCSSSRARARRASADEARARARGSPSREIHRLSRSQHRSAQLLRGGRRVRVRVANGDAGTGAARSDGAGHARGVHGRARHALDPHRGLRRVRGSGKRRRRSPSRRARRSRLPPDDPRRAQLRAHAESWASQAMARRLLSFYEKVRAEQARTARATNQTASIPRPEKVTAPIRRRSVSCLQNRDRLLVGFDAA